MPRSHRTTTSRAGYGAPHQKARRALIRTHVDGTRCTCTCPPTSRCPCRRAGYPPGTGLPMYRRASLNPHRRPLHADHTHARVLGGELPDRLIHGTCNLILGAILGNQLRGAQRHGHAVPPAMAMPKPRTSRAW
jgi:hypothetical protein